MKRFLFTGVAVAMLMQSAVFANDVEDFEDAEYSEEYAVSSSKKASSAADITSEAVKAALNHIKTIIDVPQNFDDMSYDIFDDTIQVTWNDTQADESSYIMVTAGFDGTLYYYIYSDGKYGDGTPNMSNAANAQNTAETFIKKVIGDDFANFKLSKRNNDYNGADFTYQQYFNSVPVEGAYISVSVDYESGAVTQYRNETADKSLLKEENNVISADKAKQNYIDNIGFDLHYKTVYDKDSETARAVPVYEKNRNGKSYIDAVTGDVVGYEDSSNERATGYDSLSAEESASDADAGSYSMLTEKEISKSEEIDGLIGVDKAVGIIKSAFPIEENEELESSSILKTSYGYQSSLAKNTDGDGGYIYDLWFDNSRAKVNAKTGEITDFYYHQKNDYDTKKSTSRVINYESAKTVAKTVIDKIFNGDVSALGEPKRETYSDNYETVTYYRENNGIEYPENYVTVDIDNNSRVVGYRKVWYKVDFEPSDKLITQAQAFAEFANWQKYSLKYVYNNKTEKYKLVYDFDGRSGYYYGLYLVNALTGKAMSYNGSDYTEKTTGSYTDIDNHWCKDIVEGLALMGFSLEGDEFRPDDPITKNEFSTLLFGYRSNNGADGDEYMTRYDAAEYVFGDLFGFKILKDKDELFVQPFEDVDEEHYAEVAFLKGMGMINDAKDFNGEKLLTRAEAASMIYNAIKNNSLN